MKGTFFNFYFFILKIIFTNFSSANHTEETETRVSKDLQCNEDDKVNFTRIRAHAQTRTRQPPTGVCPQPPPTLTPTHTAQRPVSSKA